MARAQIFFFLAAGVIGMPQAAATPFDERAAEVIRHFAGVRPSLTGTPKYTFFLAEAKFRDYAVNGAASQLAEARALVNAGLENLNASDPPFQLWRALDCFLRWGPLFDAALKEKAKARLVASPEYDYHDTENKIWMAATARFLATEAWPDGRFGSGFSAADPTGRATLLAKMQAFVREGETEHNSPTYFAMHYGPLRSLADFAKDPEVRKRAALTAEWLLVSAAGEWLEGMWCAPTLRIYRENSFSGQSTYGAGTAVLWLLFGGPTPTNWYNELVDAVQTACSSYRPPALLTSLAQDRSAPYIHRETHQDMATQFFSTTYMAGQFSLYSEREIFSSWGSAGGMDQVNRWSLAFQRGRGNNRFFVQHYNGTKTENVGSTEYEQVLQHRQALIGVWNKPAVNVVGNKGQNSSNPILGWIPEDPAAVINASSTQGRIYLHYGNVLIALHMSQPFTWDGRSTRFSLAGTARLGMVLEVAAPAAYPGASPAAQLAAFQTAFEKDWSVRADLSGIQATSPRLAYQALDGTRLETVFRGPDRIDGITVDYERSKWPLLENPWTRQAFRGDSLVVMKGNQVRIYDFRSWTVRDSTSTTRVRVGEPSRYLWTAAGACDLLGRSVPVARGRKQARQAKFRIP